MRRAAPALVLVLAGATGCRVMFGGPESSGGIEEPPVPSSVVSQEAPEACGFPPGTALEYAGRSTTAELDVQEVVGDPMSDDPADIYITRDAFDQGELHGRLVCAIFVNDPGFVEITVHPEDGGRFEPTTPGPAPSAPANGISEDEATDLARAALDEPGEWEFAAAEAGPLERVMAGSYLDQEWAQHLSADRWVWRIFFVRGDRGVDVVVDYVDGLVLGTVEYIVN